MHTIQTSPDIGIYTININEGFTRDLDSKDVERGVGGGPAVGNCAHPITHPHLPPPPRRRRFFRFRWTYLFNAVIVIIVGIIVLLFELGIIPFSSGGFYCNDPAISFKFDGDTVPNASLIVGCGFIPIIMILVVELILYRPEKFSISNARCFSALRNIYVWYREYLVGMVFTLTFMEVAKFVVGEPRPHFLDTCAPKEADTCTTGQFITHYTCTNTEHSSYFVRDSSKSFPSGHTACSVFMGLFLFGYLQARVCSMRPRVLGPFLQALVVSWSLVCSLSRITDHRHHWWDVLAGSILGAIMAYYSVTVLCKQFVCDNPQLSRSVTSNGDSGRSLDNHNSVRRLISTSSIKQEDLDNDIIVPVTA